MCHNYKQERQSFLGFNTPPGLQAPKASNAGKDVSYIMCQTPSKTQTNERTDKETRRFVCICLSVCPLCLSGATILWVDEARCFVEI